jgi:hypothetical protein
MTIAELKALTGGDRVRFADDKRPGRVHAADPRCVEIHWPDGTSTLIWFAHCADGRDARFAFLRRVEPRQGKAPDQPRRETCDEEVRT